MSESKKKVRKECNENSPEPLMQERELAIIDCKTRFCLKAFQNNLFFCCFLTGNKDKEKIFEVQLG